MTLTIQACEKQVFLAFIIYNKDYHIINESTNQTIDLNGQIIVYLGNVHLHMKGSELVDIILKRADEIKPKIGVRQQFGVLRKNENGQDEMSIAYGVMTEDGIKLD